MFSKQQTTEVSGHARHAEAARAILAQKQPGLSVGNPVDAAQVRLLQANAHATLALYELLKEQNV